MNVYDFDKTIYDGDSTLDFYCFCFRQYPSIALLLPGQIASTVQYGLKKIEKTQWKEAFFVFLSRLEYPEALIDLFWEKHSKRIMPWYLKQRQASDVIISASPEFLLKPICKKLGVEGLIASCVDQRTGRFLKPNCYGEEKRRRFYEQYPGGEIDAFYSDSFSDLPLASIAKQAYLIRGKAPQIWTATEGR